MDDHGAKPSPSRFRRGAFALLAFVAILFLVWVLALSSPHPPHFVLRTQLLFEAHTAANAYWVDWGRFPAPSTEGARYPSILQWHDPVTGNFRHELEALSREETRGIFPADILTLFDDETVEELFETRHPILDPYGDGQPLVYAVDRSSSLLLMSRGPDGDFDFHPSTIEFDDEGRLVEPSLVFAYDPSNGANSSGDLWIFESQGGSYTVRSWKASDRPSP